MVVFLAVPTIILVNENDEVESPEMPTKAPTNEPTNDDLMKEEPLPIEEITMRCCESAESLETLRGVYNELKKRNQDLAAENASLRSQLSAEEGKKTTTFLADVKELMKFMLSPAQMDLALKLNDQVDWSDQDLQRAMTIKCVSSRISRRKNSSVFSPFCRYYEPRIYKYLRTKMNYPLPCPDALTKQADDRNIYPECLDFAERTRINVKPSGDDECE